MVAGSRSSVAVLVAAPELVRVVAVVVVSPEPLCQ